MRELFKELGFAPSQMTTINNDLLSRLDDENVQSLNTEEFTQMFNEYMVTYNQAFNRSGVPVDRDLQSLYHQYNGTLSQLASKLTASSVIGPDGKRIENVRIIAPPRYLMTPSQYVEEYNKLLSQSRSEINNYYGVASLEQALADDDLADIDDDEAEYGGEEDAS